MEELKKYPTDRLVEELISRQEKETIPCWYIIRKLVEYELHLIQYADETFKDNFNKDITDAIVAIAKITI